MGQNELVTLKKIEQSKLAIREVKNLDEIKKIIDQSEALKAYAKSAQVSAEIQADIQELNLRATRRLGEISAAMEKAKGNRYKKVELPQSGNSKTATLSAAGIDIRRANEAEKIAAIPEKVFEQKIAEAKTISADLTKSAILQSIKKDQRDQKYENIKRNLEDISAQKAKALKGVYDVIVIDPPWQMEKIEREERPNQMSFDYPTMSENELAELKIPAAKDCHIFTWTTHKHLPMTLRLLEKWGFKYVCTFVWHKNGGFQPFGLPQYNCEFCLYAHRGSPQFVDFKNFFTCFNADRTAHSEKPEIFYETLRRVTAGRRLDMFNRRKIKGFDGWGNESK